MVATVHANGVPSMEKCWPFCFIPLMMRRDKSVRTLCPCCGHDYGICTEAESKLIACSPECASSRGKLSDFANSRTCHLRTKCGGSRMELGRRQRYADSANVNDISRMTKKTLSMGDEATRTLRVPEVRPRREEGGSRRCRSQSKLSRGYAFCANQVTVSRRYRGILYRMAPPVVAGKYFQGSDENRGSPYDEYSSDDCVDDKRWDRRRDLDKSRASKAREQSESEGSSGAGTATGDFYARQVCCRECG
ncbi:Uncharacterized protein DBV15_11479 [Temnothorax longispinosus]|uniref:Uncharacterized protein n=1 Tax=Temnothorax longispinosus TaxID=300112 RepID=A0A4S2KAA6_9HYME|nr:Uncharacterized protein DBV15_11479 [Temnothorax longispinosus]